MGKLADFFRFSERNTNARVEILAGLTTFVTMAYVLVVTPGAIVGSEAAVTDMTGLVIGKEAVVITVALVSALITIMMGFYSNMPFALSTGMGTNFLLGAMIQSGTLSFSQAMGIILTEGIIFLVLSIFGIRDLIVRMIPKNIKIAISAAIGFFIAYLGFKNSGLATFSASGMHMGDFTQPTVILSLVCLIIIAVLTAYKVKGAILFGILIATIIGIPMGLTTLPSSLVSVPNFSSISSVFWKLDLVHIWNPTGIILIFVAFFGDFFSTLGTVLGLGGKAGMLDEDGNLPGIEKPFLIDAIGTCVGAIFGCTTITTFVESSAGVEAGGRTGLTALTTGILFFFATFLAPLALMIPNCATGPALIFVGFLMVQGFKDIDFSDFTEAFGPFVMIMFVIYMGSIAAGIAGGILAHILIKVATGKAKEINIGMYILAVPLILYFIYS